MPNGQEIVITGGSVTIETDQELATDRPGSSHKYKYKQDRNAKQILFSCGESEFSYKPAPNEPFVIRIKF